MDGIRAQLDVLEACAAALSAEGGTAGAAAEALGQVHVAEGATGRTPASGALAQAITAAAAHWSGELTSGAQTLTATGLAVDQSAVAVRGADTGFASSLGGAG
ncbi:hypothetical protein GCM10027047_33570 [Rhodococcus aerolatus]